MKKFLFSILCFFCYSLLMAEPIDMEKAKSIATKFLLKKNAEINTTKSRLRREKIRLVHHQETKSGAPAYYIFDNTSKGFVIVSGDDRVSEIMGYSDSGDFDINKIPDGLKDLLNNYTQQIEVLERNPEKNVAKKESRNWVNVHPMLVTIWDQIEPFNAYCPKDPSTGERTLTGCTTTAIAQIMNYHKFPDVGRGIISYKWKDQDLSIDLSKVRFDWDKMSNTEEADSAIANLMYSVAMVCTSDFGTEDTNGYFDTYRLFKSFYYKNTMKYLTLAETSLSNFEETIYEDLCSNRPVLFPDFVIVSPRNSHRTEMRFSDDASLA